MGDAVDNVPGVPGIGEKGARQLVAEFGSVEALLERAAEVPRKAYREGLQTHREQALLSKELVTIHTDLPIELHPESLQLDVVSEWMAIKRARSEVQSFGFCYTEVSAGIAGQSHFPQTLVDALHFAHKPLENEVYEPLAGRSRDPGRFFGKGVGGVCGGAGEERHGRAGRDRGSPGSGCPRVGLVVG